MVAPIIACGLLLDPPAEPDRLAGRLGVAGCWFLGRLERQGVFTTGLLIEVSETPTRRQTLADQVDATTNDVLAWRDEALMLNLASFGPEDHQLLMQAGIDGLRDILALDIDTFRARLGRAAIELNVDPPADLTTSGWWDQARTLED